MHKYMYVHPLSPPPPLPPTHTHTHTHAQDLHLLGATAIEDKLQKVKTDLMYVCPSFGHRLYGQLMWHVAS